MQNLGIDFDHVNAEMPISYPSRDFKWAARYVNCSTENKGQAALVCISQAVVGQDVKDGEENRFKD